MRQPIAFVAGLVLVGLFGGSTYAFALPVDPLRAATPDRSRFLERQLRDAPRPAADDARGLTQSATQSIKQIASQAIKSVATKLAALETRPRLLMPLYGSLIALQALDIDSTSRAIRTGVGREANPLLQAAAGSPIALLVVKAGTTTAIIVASERLRRNGHPVAAIALMVGINSAYAMVAAHNYNVVRTRR